jgi:hypothetical protein
VVAWLLSAGGHAPVLPFVLAGVNLLLLVMARRRILFE